MEQALVLEVYRGKSEAKVEKFVLRRPKDISSFVSGQSKVSVTRKLKKFLLYNFNFSWK